MSQENDFEIRNQKSGAIEIFYLKGYLDAHTAPMLEDAIEEAINQGTAKLLINFKDLDYISSAGLGVFMAYIEDLRNKGGDIKMAEMKEKVFSVFDLLGFPLLFNIEKEEQVAIAKFNEDSNEEFSKK